MAFFNFNTGWLRTPEFASGTPEEQATWLNLLTWCADVRNNGRIAEVKDFTINQWLQMCGVKRATIREPSQLFWFEGNDLVLWNHPIDPQVWLQKIRPASFIFETQWRTSPWFVDEKPRQRITWLRLLAWCTLMENGGRIENASDWTNDMWLRTAGVSKPEVNAPSKLLQFIGKELYVKHYSMERQIWREQHRATSTLGGSARSEKKAAAARENGKRGGRPRKNPGNPTGTHQETERK